LNPRDVKKEKLIFRLCTKCFDEKYNDCTHSDEERAIIGTWTSDEISKALEKGYKIIEINEVWHFKEKATIFLRARLKNS